MSSSPADLSRKLRRTGESVGRAATTGTVQAARAAKATMVAGGQRANIPSRSRKWQVRDAVSRSGAGALNKGEALVFYTGGPPYWRERGTRPHVIAPKGLGGSRAGRQAAITAVVGARASGRLASRGAIGKRAVLKVGEGYAAYARHPGAAARPFFAAVRASVAQITPGVYRRATSRAVTEAFR